MPDTILVLGGFVFTDFEIPPHISYGGEQRLVVHKLQGGARVIDAMGPDDDDLSWSGRFQGPLASDHARQLDTMRRAGQAYICSWSTKRYRVVIEDLKLNEERWYQILYSIRCKVVEDLTIPPNSNVGLTQTDTTASAIASDLATAGTIAAQVRNGNVTSALGTLSATVASGASTTAQQNAVASTVAQMNVAYAQANQSVAGLGGLGGVTPGALPGAAAAGLLASVAAYSDMSLLTTATSYVYRIGRNIGLAA